MKLCRVLKAEYCGNPEHHEYELYLAVEDVDHSRTKTKSPRGRHGRPTVGAWAGLSRTDHQSRAATMRAPSLLPADPSKTRPARSGPGARAAAQAASTSIARVQAEIADELLRFIEARYLADRRLHGECHDHVDAWDRHQPFDALVRQRRAGEVALDHLQVLAKPVELAQMPFDRQALILRHDLIDEPGTARRPAQIGQAAE